MGSTAEAVPSTYFKHPNQDLHNFQLLKKDEKTRIFAQIWIIACRVSGADNVSGGNNRYSFCMDLTSYPVRSYIGGQRAGFVRNDFNSAVAC
jgi:hypothetical protein